ncbi:MAG: hypothetical protein ACPG7F_00285 [Aggregatilineales bacterium]
MKAEIRNLKIKSLLDVKSQYIALPPPIFVVASHGDDNNDFMSFK